MQKKDLRRQFLALRDEIPTEDRFQLDESILLSLLSLKEYRHAETVMIFVSYKSEVDTHAVITESLRRGKRVLVPIVQPEDHTLLLGRISNMQDLVPGAYGILEPREDRRDIYPARTVDFVLVPGAVFDRRGYRIGYGGGYYDRLIPTFRRDAVLCGIGYECQLTESVPTEAHDQKLDLLITEKNVYRF